MSERSVYNAVGQPEDTRGIARRVAQIQVSAIKQMPVLAARLGGCVSLGQGIPSLQTPAFIREAVANELMSNEDIGKYSLQPGLPQLKAEIARRLQRLYNIVPLDCDKELFVACGAMEAIAAAICTVIERGDEVIVASPNYSSHIEQILFAEGIPIFVPLDEGRGWALDLNRVEDAITGKTKALLICNPMNPTGAVMPPEVVRGLSDIARRHNLFVIADEAYDFLIYDAAPFLSFSAIPELREQLIAVYSFSKMFCMTGWRVGYMFSSPRIIDQVLKVHDAFNICAPTISQYAALAGLMAMDGECGLGDQSVRTLITTLEARRELMARRLDRLSSVFSYVKPRGAYYYFVKLMTSEQRSVSLALKLLHEAKVITIPGSGFGPTGEGHLRLSFGGTDEVINEAFDRIERWAARF